MLISRVTLAIGLLALLAGTIRTTQAGGQEPVESWSAFVAGNAAIGDGTASAAGQCDCDIDLVRCQCDCPTWIVNVGDIFLQRGTPTPTTLVHVAGNPGAILINANVFRFNYAAGADISAIRRVSGFDLFDAIDVRFFDTQSSQAVTSITTSQVWALPTSPLLGGGLTPGPLEFSYHTRLYSTELNLRRFTPGGRLTWLAGARWIQLNEQMYVAGNFFGIGSNAATFNTQNNLFGGQFGANYSFWNHGPLSIIGTGKAGVYGNAAGGQSNNAFVNSSDRVSRFAFVGDLNVNAICQVSEHIAVRLGWQLLWIEGAATASNQVAASNYHTSSGINTAGTAFYQGAMSSVTFSW